MLLGIFYAWSGIILAWLLIFTSLSLTIINLSFGISGPVLLSFTIIYFIWKKKGFIPIIGAISGLIIGFLLLYLFLGLGAMK